jgi:hypothetical protein
VSLVSISGGFASWHKHLQHPRNRPSLDYDKTLVHAIELSNASWVLAAPVPGLPRVRAKQAIAPTTEALLSAIASYRMAYRMRNETTRAQ